MRLLGWAIAVILALLVAVFAVVNRQPVVLELWPLPWSLSLPLYLAVLGSLVIGMVVGGIAAWASGHRARRTARQQRRRADALARQLEIANAASAQKHLPPPDSGA